MSQSIAEALEKLLADDKNLDTRAGLRLYAELVKDAFKFIEANKTLDEDTKDNIVSIKTRLTNVENGLSDFMELRKKEQEKNESERSKWRWAIIAPTITLIVVEIAKWLLNR